MQISTSFVAFLLALTIIISSTLGQTTERDIGVEARPLAGQDIGSSAGVFVGVNEFVDDDNIRDLRYAVNDAIAQAHLFVIQLRLIPAKNSWICLGGDPSGTEARAKLQALRKAGVNVFGAKKNQMLESCASALKKPQGQGDTIVFFISTHGFSVSGESHLVPEDAKLAWLRETTIRLRSLAEQISDSPAGKKLILLDACRNNPRTDVKALNAEMLFSRSLHDARGIAIISSCSTGEVSYESVDLESGVFTHFFISAFSGSAPSDARGLISLGAISEAAANRASKWVRAAGLGRQTPTFRGTEEARQIPLAVHPKVSAEYSAFEKQVTEVTNTLRKRIDEGGAYSNEVFKKSLALLKAAGPDERGKELLDNCRKFVSGTYPAEVFASYIQQAPIESVDASNSDSARADPPLLRRGERWTGIIKTRGRKRAALIEVVGKSDADITGTLSLASDDAVPQNGRWSSVREWAGTVRGDSIDVVCFRSLVGLMERPTRFLGRLSGARDFWDIQ